MIPFLGTALGSASVLFMKNRLQPLLQRALTGVAAGVMAAASIWSLLIPAALKALGEEGYIFVDNTHEVHLTQRGKRIAEDTYERHNTFRQLLTRLGVDEKTASMDACEMEHAVSQKSYEALKKTLLRQRTRGD